MDATTDGVDTLGPDTDPALAFLAAAGRVLGASLDYRRTLQGLSELGLGVLGDACLVGLNDDNGQLRIVAGAHIDLAKQSVVEALRDVPVSPCSQTAAVTRSGRSCVLAAIDDERLAAVLDGKALRLVRQLDLGPTMIVPLVVGGHRIGVLVFSASPGGRLYDAADVALGEELARRAASAIDNAKTFSRTSDMAHTLQQRLLPPRLPHIPGIDLAAQYHPAGQQFEVGGDFYDAFLVRDDWGLLIGDVAGKGPAAAATTAVVRSTARAVARFASRLDVAAAVNDALLDIHEPEGFCTMTYAELRLHPGRIVLSILNCGHPAPLLAGANGEIRELTCHGSLLGQFPDVAVGSLTLDLRPGETVVFVTDGVLEARAPRHPGDMDPINLFDHDGLVSTLAAATGQSAATLAWRIQQAATAFSGGRLGDDLATLVIRVLELPDGQPT